MSRTPQSHSWPARPQRAFTLVEIAVVVTLLGLLIAIALPGYRKVTLKSKAAALMNDLRTFSGAFVNYNLQNTSWPVPTGNPGEIPSEMLKSVGLAFTRPSPVGGKYVWISGSGSPPVKAAIGIATVSDSPLNDDKDLLELVDRMIDDGDLEKGNLQYQPGQLIYTIEP